MRSCHAVIASRGAIPGADFLVRTKAKSTRVTRNRTKKAGVRGASCEFVDRAVAIETKSSKMTRFQGKGFIDTTRGNGLNFKLASSVHPSTFMKRKPSFWKSSHCKCLRQESIR